MGSDGCVGERNRIRENNLENPRSACIRVQIYRFWGGSRGGFQEIVEGLLSRVPVATFNRDKNLIKAPRARLAGFGWVIGVAALNRDEILAFPLIGYAMGGK